MKRPTEGLSSKDFDRLKSALDEAAIVAITDPAGIITYVNRKFCAISKYSQDELIGSTHKLINSNFHAKEFFLNMWQSISAGSTWEGEIRNRAKDGTHYWVHTTIVPFLDATGAPERYVAVRYDITEKKLAEDQLNIYAKKLELSNQELQNFASVAAHDLQEPLRKIQSFSDRLKAKAKEDLKPDAFDYVDRIQTSAHRMQILINDLLTYSRVTTNAQPFALLDLNKVVAQVVSDLEVRLEKCQGEVKWAKLPSIEADATQMHQLFQNLIGNALKFHKPGSAPQVNVTAKIINEPSLLGKMPICQISIQDDGIGFEEKYLDRIFTIFQRLHGRNEFEGTGIGLAICRKIMDRHRGFITAKSISGEGATFLVSLPVKQSTG